MYSETESEEERDHIIDEYSEKLEETTDSLRIKKSIKTKYSTLSSTKKNTSSLKGSYSIRL